MCLQEVRQDTSPKTEMVWKRQKNYNTVSDFTNTTLYQLYQAVKRKQILSRQ